VSDDRLDITPEPTPAEAEAIRRALEALGLLEGAPADGGSEVGSDPASTAVSGS
jgi:hypothetical protein